MNNGIVFACNNSFFDGLVVGIKSLRFYNPGIPIEILNTGLAKSQVEALTLMGGVKVIDIQNDLQMNFTQKRSWHTDFSVYGSLFVEKSSFDNILFCDTDLLFLGNLDNVFSLIERYDIVATKANSIYAYFAPQEQVLLKRYITNKGRYEIENNIETNVNWNYVTFNSGFWGIKRDYFMELKSKYWHLLKSLESEFTFHDQTFINLVCCLDNKCYYDLGFSYNAVNVSSTNIYMSFKSLVKYIINKVLKRNYKIQYKKHKWNVSYRGNDVRVLHYTGSNKPFFHQKLYGDAIHLWNYYKQITGNL